jgi:aerobic carbon-monoxide dehydrogenase large subunit
VPRKEDARLLTGGGSYSDDLDLPGQAYAVMVRSPHAHARIVEIDAAEAAAAPGVLAVLTGRDYLADGLKPIPHRPFSASPPDVSLQNRDGSAIFVAPHYPLPADKARFVGEAVAMVVAETLAAAHDAAERVHVKYETLAATVLASDAAAHGAPRLWEERPSNVTIDADLGDAAATDAAFARAAHVVRLETRVQRVTGVPLEPRAALGVYDAGTKRYTLHAGSGGVVRQKRELAAMLGVEEGAVRVVARDTGGNFGTKNSFFPEFVLVGGEAPRPPGQMDLRARRSVSFRLPGPRPDRRSRARARRSRQFPGAARVEPEQCRRLLGLARAALQRRVDHHQRLPVPRGVRPRARGALEYAPHDAVPQRGAARGDLRHRAAHRPRRAQARVRSR